MKAFAIIIDDKTKKCAVGMGEDVEFYKKAGMTEEEVEQAWDGAFYISGYAPDKPEEITAAEEISILKQKLADSDYAIIKIAEGAATREEYADVIKQRAEWRTQINELEAGLE